MGASIPFADFQAGYLFCAFFKIQCFSKMAESDHNSESGSHISESEPEFSDADTVSQPDSLIKRAGITLTSRSTSNGAKNKTKPNDKTTNSRTERTAQPGTEARKRLHKKNGRL